jgi:hypothetical protein
MMAEKKGGFSWIIWGLAIGFVVLCVLWVLSIFGVLPLTYTEVKTPRALNEFLDSPKGNMRGIKINGHFLEIGKRPALQILKGYEDYMYLMRPYRQVKKRTRNLTGPEVFDFCTNVTGDDFDDLQSKVVSGKGYTPAWNKKINNQTVELIKTSLFSYLVTGLSGKPIFITQVELAKRLGMDEAKILERIIPVQKSWYSELAASSSMDKPYPSKYTTPMRDELIAWLDER